MLALPVPVRAQDDFGQALSAYNDIDFDGTIEHAEAAIASGELEPDQLSVLYRLLGLALSALDRAPEARQAFIRLLAIDPEPPIEPVDLPPQQRSVYMEALGYWAPISTRLGAEHTFNGGQLRLELTDPATLMRRVRVFFRPDAQGPYNRLEADAGRRVDLTLAGTRERAEIYYELTDEHGNIILRRGSDLAPIRVGRWEVAPPPEEEEQAPPDRTPYVVGGTVLAVVAAGSLATAVVSHILREDAARTFNEDPPVNCSNWENPSVGNRREDVCSAEQSTVNTFTPLAITFYAVGGAAAIASVLLFVLAPPAPPGPGDAGEEGEPAARFRLRCGGGPGEIGLACGSTF